MIGIILAAGEGNRLKAGGNKDICKPLVIINKKRLIEFSLDNLVELGIERAFIVVGKESRLIKEVVGNRYKEMEINYVSQPEPNGMINAFVRALDAAGYDETVVLQLSDEIFLDLKTEEIKHITQNGEYDFYCGVTFEEDAEKIKSNFSVDINPDNTIYHCTEKPDVVTNKIKGTGFCIATPKSIQLLRDIYNAKTNRPFDLCDYINTIIEKKQRVFALQIAKKEFNINTLEDYIKAQNILN